MGHTAHIPVLWHIPPAAQALDLAAQKSRSGMEWLCWRRADMEHMLNVLLRYRVLQQQPKECKTEQEISYACQSIDLFTAIKCFLTCAASTGLSILYTSHAPHPTTSQP